MAMALVAASCGGGGGHGGLILEKASTTVSTKSSAGSALGASELERLLVAPPPPYAQISDSELGTGLMEVGNPRSGTIGIGWAQEPDLTKAGMQRGWEKAFRAPDRATVLDHVFEFRTTDGPTGLLPKYQSSVERSYQKFDVAGVPGAVEFLGTSPEGRTVVISEAAHGRFLFGGLVGGPPGAHPYRELLESLMRQQVAALH